MEKQPFSVYSVKSIKDFKEHFSHLLKVTDSTIAQKDPIESQIFGYLTRYLKTENHGIKVETIICEHDYTCLNFLEDYANYYSRTYTDYNKKCKRIHFFSVNIAEDEFKTMILDKDNQKWKNYKGCIVVKPIPKGIIGVTYLKTYDHYLTENGRGKYENRYYKCLTNHKVNVFGNEQYILTMPFKEQDGVVASCASTALWMAFHKTSELYTTKTPSLSEITILAGSGDDTGLIFPSKFLNTTQICNVIIKLGMLPELRDQFNHVSYFKSKLHAYLKGDIPVLLGMKELEGAKDRYNHLVTMNGFRYKENKYQLKEKNNDEETLEDAKNKMQLLSDSIEMFYVNDSQVGPFSRTEIYGENEDIQIKTSWGVKKGIEYSETEMIIAKPAFTIIPLTPTIKVSFEDTYVYYLTIKSLIELIISSTEPHDLRYNFDIYLTKSNEYKKKLLGEYKKLIESFPDNSVDIGETIEKVLTTSFPKYIWVIEARDLTGLLIFDFIYDSVEIRQSGLPISINIYNSIFSKAVVQSIEVFENYGSQIEKSFKIDYNSFKNSYLGTTIELSIRNSKDTVNNHLSMNKPEIEENIPLSSQRNEFVKKVRNVRRIRKPKK